MQAVSTLVLRHIEHTLGVQIAFIRGITTNANQCVVIGELINRRGFHIWIALH